MSTKKPSKPTLRLCSNLSGIRSVGKSSKLLDTHLNQVVPSIFMDGRRLEVTFSLLFDRDVEDDSLPSGYIRASGDFDAGVPRYRLLGRAIKPALKRLPLFSLGWGQLPPCRGSQKTWAP